MASRYQIATRGYQTGDSKQWAAVHMPATRLHERAFMHVDTYALALCRARSDLSYPDKLPKCSSTLVRYDSRHAGAALENLAIGPRVPVFPGRPM
jgi:hypothetical protein